MWRNYLLAGFRHILKQKLFSAINILGLGLGLASCISILLFVRNELSYDTFWPEADAVYHASWHTQPPGRAPAWLGVTPGPLAPQIKGAMPEDIALATRVMTSMPALIKDGQGIAAYTYYVDANFFDMFKAPFLAGDPATALMDASGLVMTRSAAIKYFGTLDILGRQVDLDTGRSFVVSGLVEDLPDTSTLNYEILIPLLDTDFVEDGIVMVEDWGNIGFHTYLKLQSGVSKERVEEQFGPFIDRVGPNWGNDFVASEQWQLELTPLAKDHLEGASRGRIKPKGDYATIYSFSAIALLILAIACLNFMNLSTARSASRAREVAVRKVLGANQLNIVQQFMAETAVTVLLAILLALALVELALPMLNELLVKMLRLDYVNDPLSLAALAGLALVTIIGAGLHPALVTARYRPASVLRSGRSAPAGSGRLRMALVVIQFSISIFLISAALLVYRQLDHMNSVEKGFTPENVIWIRDIDHPSIEPSQETLKKRLLDQPNLTDAAYSWTLPGYSGRSLNTVDHVDGKAIEVTAITSRYIDFDYFQTYRIAILAGRNFSREHANDSIRHEDGWSDGSVVVNKASLGQFGIASPETAIGKTLTLDDITLTIVGVVGDTMVDHVKGGVEPMIYMVDPMLYWRLGVRFTGSPEAAQAAIESVWHEMFPLVPLRTAFLEDTLAEQFAQDRERGQVFAVFAGLAVLISLLGLYGLASFSTEQRSKEIGVRKVLGARSRDIVFLLVWQFSKPVILASVLAWPAAFLFINDWMQQFPVQVGYGFLAFAGPSLLALVLAWLSVGGHAWRVAGTNPIKALKYE